MRFSLKNERRAVDRQREIIEAPFDMVLEMIGGEECSVHWDRDYDGGPINALSDAEGILIGIWDPTTPDSDSSIKYGCVVVYLALDGIYGFVRWVYCVKDGHGFWVRETVGQLGV